MDQELCKIVANVEKVKGHCKQDGQEQGGERLRSFGNI